MEIRITEYTKTTLKVWNQVVEITVSHSKNYYKVTVIKTL